MKSKITLIFCFSLLLGSGYTQCNTIVPPWPASQQITNDQHLYGEGMFYWICSGVTVTLDSSDGSVFVMEPNSILNVNGASGEMIYAKENCVINNYSDATLAVSVNPATVTLNNNGPGNIIIGSSCPNITYDYSMVGGSGAPCNVLTSTEEETNQVFTIFPNPVAAGQNITLYAEIPTHTPFSVLMYDVYGKMIKSTQLATNQLSTEGLASGTYYLSVQTPSGTQRSKIIIY